MMRSNGFVAWTAGAALVLAAAGAWRAVARNEMLAPAGPPVVAVLNLERVLNNLDELGARQSERQALIDQRRAMVEKLQRDLDQAKTDLNILPKNSPDYQKKLEEALLTQATLEFQQKLATQLLDNKTAEISKNLFEKIRDATARLAKQRGYNLVLSNDSESPIELGDVTAVTRQLAMRKIMYADPSLDISDDVLQLMNNEWKAGGGAAPAAQAAPGGKPGGF